jgi:hypothetical protein
MEPRDPATKPYRVATYVIFMAFVLVLCVLTAAGIIAGL